MSYAGIHQMQSNIALRARITACAAQEGKTWAQITEPMYFYKLASSPGWGAAWASAEAGGVADPGANEGVITDGMILSAVQAAG